MVFFKAIQAIGNLDIGFFIGVILGNIFFVFALYAMIHIFFNGKKTIYFFVLFAFTLWALIDLETLTGIGITGTLFLLFYYVSKLALLGFVESVPALKKYMIVVSSVSAYLLAWFFVFFVGS